MVERKRRVVTPANLMLLATHLACYPWQKLYEADGVDSMLNVFEEAVFNAQEAFCPEEVTRIRLNPKFHVTPRLARLSKLKAAEFKANRYSRRFKELQKLAKEEKRSEHNEEKD